MVDHLESLPTILVEQGAVSAILTEEVALYAASLEWTHRDPFERIIAATAVHGGQTLVSADRVFDSFPDPRLSRTR